MAIHIDPAGGIIKELGLIYFPLGNARYIYNIKGSKGVTTAEYHEEQDERKKAKTISWWGIRFNDKEFVLRGKPIMRNLSGVILEDEEIQKWIESPTQKPEEIYKEVKESIKLCYDFINERDYDLCTIFIFQSWFEEFLQSVFYLGISSKMGAGKTVLLEILKSLFRQGILANDISFAAIPRIIDKYKANLCIDEIDQIDKKEQNEIYKILRQGYRKGSYYIRLKQKTFEEEFFNVFGTKAFSFRSDIVDDLKGRSYIITPPLSNDKKLPLINYFKDVILAPIYKKLLFFYLNKSLEIVNEVNEYNKVIVNIYNSNTFQGIGGVGWRGKFLAEQLANLPNFVNSVNPDVEEMIKTNFSKLTGRNIELLFSIMILCKLIGLDIVDWFKSCFEEKEEFDKYDEIDFKIILKDVMLELYPTALDHDGIKLVPHRNVARAFNKKVFEEHGLKPSSKELKKWMREIGFIDKVNRKVVKVDGKATLCLIYDAYIKKVLDIEDQDTIKEEDTEKSNDNNKSLEDFDDLLL